MPPAAQTTRLQSTLRLLIPRLRLLQKKDTASSVAQRRELAQLLDSGREASARIRVENVIANDIAVEVMEMVELYCELLLARAPVLDQVAFGEKGIRARNRAKEEAAAAAAVGNNVAGAAAGGRDRKSAGGGGLFSGAFGVGSKTPTTTPTKQKEDNKDEEQEQPEEEYIDAGLDEAAAAIFYSWPRFPREVRELTTLRNLLMERWGKDFATLATDNKVAIKVPERLVKRLRLKPPSVELVESYLREIAKAYGVAWPKEDNPSEENDLADQVLDYPDKESFVDDDKKSTGGGDVPATESPPRAASDQQLQPPSTPQRPNLAELRRESEAEELSRATPPRDIGPHDATGRSPVSVAPPAPRSDNPNPRVRIPGEQENTNNKTAPTASSSVAPTSNTTTTASTTASPSNTAPARKESIGSKIPDVDELSKRFAALKR